MNLHQRALLALFPLVLAAFPLTRSAVAAPAVDAGAFAHCAAISGADERLACYDSLARPRPGPPAAAAAAAAPPVKATSQSASATHPAAATAAPATTAAGTAAAGTAATGAAAATAEPAAKSFGLTQHVAPAEQGPDRIQAQATRVDIDRLGTVRLSLDNGQVWTFNAPEALIRVGDTITIKRGALGSFLLTTPEHHTYKAQRSQ
jgi:hypothetical protein